MTEQTLQLHQTKLQKSVEETAQKDVYVMKQMTEEQLSAPITDHMKSRGLQSVRQVARSVMPNVYGEIDRKRVSALGADRRFKVHHARGTQISESGKPVLKLDFAGSGFKYFRNEHNGIKGKNDRIRLDDLENQEQDGYLLEEEEKKIQKEIEVSWYNKTRWLNWIPGIRTEEQINQANQEIQRKNEIQQRRINKIKAVIESKIGESVTVDGKKLDFVRKRVKGSKTTISMAGPDGGILGISATKGMRNSGDYSIEKTREYALTLGSEYLKGIFTSGDYANHPHDVTIVIKGHSRGGVASAQGAMMLRRWVKEKYPRFLKYVKFELTQYDPVPGLGSASGINEKIDMSGDEVTDKDGVKLMGLGNSVKSTVFYSMDVEHRAGFTPQTVKGAQRVILAPSKHGIGLGDIEATTVNKTDGSQTRELHRPGYTDARTGDVYRSSGISELPEGLYMLDESNTLIKVNSAQEALTILEKAISGTSSAEDGRHEVLRNVIRDYFA